MIRETVEMFMDFDGKRHETEIDCLLEDRACLEREIGRLMTKIHLWAHSPRRATVKLEVEYREIMYLFTDRMSRLKETLAEIKEIVEGNQELAAREERE